MHYMPWKISSRPEQESQNMTIEYMSPSVQVLQLLPTTLQHYEATT